MAEERFDFQAALERARARIPEPPRSESSNEQVRRLVAAIDQRGRLWAAYAARLVAAVLEDYDQRRRGPPPGGG